MALSGPSPNAEITRNVAVPPAPIEHLAKAARPTFCPAAVQAYAALLQDHESASTVGEPLLTQAGLVYLRHLLPAALSAAEHNGTHAAPAVNGALLPCWDAENRRLWLGTCLVKEFRQPAPNQTTLLDVFQEEGWAGGRIDDPLPRAKDEGEKDAKRRLHETVKNLNRGLKPGTIRFRGDGTGQGIAWEYQRCQPAEGCCPKRKSPGRASVFSGRPKQNVSV
jgi:hypothetical protein